MGFSDDSISENIFHRTTIPLSKKSAHNAPSCVFLEMKSETSFNDDSIDDSNDDSIRKHISGNVGTGRFARLMVLVLAAFENFHRRK